MGRRLWGLEGAEGCIGWVGAPSLAPSARPIGKDRGPRACHTPLVLPSSVCFLGRMLLRHLSGCVCVCVCVCVCLALALSSLASSGPLPCLSLSAGLRTPTDNVPDNYSLLILLVSAAPGTVFFILVGAPSRRPSQPAFLRRQSAADSKPERELLPRPRPGSLSEVGFAPPPAPYPSPQLRPWGLSQEGS